MKEASTDSILTVPLPTATFDVEYLPDQIEAHIEDFFYRSRHMLCDDLQSYNRTSSEPLRVRYQLNCQGLFDTSAFGTGNWLLFLYNVRSAVHLLGNIDLEMTCSDAFESQRDLILPWIMGTWRSRSPPSMDWETCCRPIWELDGIIQDDLRYELQRMAVSLVGLPHNNTDPVHPSFETDVVREGALQLSYQPSPLLHNISMDDVAIHFRCGDILERAPHPSYGYARFQSLAALISESSTSIGIVTQPFHGGQTRRFDEQKQGRCEILVGALEMFLKERFPQAAVTVRNDPNETIALAYARFILSNVAIAAGTSTFVTMPFRAAFGAAYEISREEMIDSVQIFNLWQEENGHDQILHLLTSNDESSTSP